MVQVRIVGIESKGAAVDAAFSEFGYGYAVVRELEATFGLGLHAPRFPTQHEEGQDGGGYDVHLSDLVFPLFLQFKRAERMERSNATEADEFGTPYLRFKLRTGRDTSRINQHNLLHQLAAMHPERVAYFAPRFADYLEFDAAYTARQVVERSIIVQPEQIGAVDDRSQHAVVFTADSADGWVLRSDPLPGTAQSPSEWLDTAMSSPITVSQLLETVDLLTQQDVSPGALRDSQRLTRTEEEPELALAELAAWLRAMVDVHLLVAFGPDIQGSANVEAPPDDATAS